MLCSSGLRKKEKKKREYFFFFNDTATTEIYTLSLHDALPISISKMWSKWRKWSNPPASMNITSFLMMQGIHGTKITSVPCGFLKKEKPYLSIHQIYQNISALLKLMRDRKSTRLNSSHIPLSRMPSSAWKKKKTT